MQGLGAGALQPTEQAILRQTFPPKEQGMAMALFGMAVMIGPAVGPTLGGYIVDNWHWSWIFFINLPDRHRSASSWSRSFVHEDRTPRRQPRRWPSKQRKNIDWLGIALLCVGLAALQYVLEEGGRNDWFDSHADHRAGAWSPSFALVAFVIRELTAPVPAVNLRLFKDPVFLSGTLIGGADVRHADGQHVPAADLHAGAARLHRDAVGHRADAARARDDGGHADRRTRSTTRSRRASSSPSACCCSAFGSWEMSHLTLESRPGQVIGAIADPGRGLCLPLRAADHGRALEHPRAPLPDATGLNSLLRQIGGADRPGHLRER